MEKIESAIALARIVGGTLRRMRALIGDVGKKMKSSQKKTRTKNIVDEGARNAAAASGEARAAPMAHTRRLTREARSSSAGSAGAADTRYAFSGFPAFSAFSAFAAFRRRTQRSAHPPPNAVPTPPA